MSLIENTEERYGVIAILFHWSMALLVIGLVILGLYMVTLPDVGFNTKKIYLIFYHKAFGILVLMLLAPRLAYCRNWLHTCLTGKKSPLNLSIFPFMH